MFAADRGPSAFVFAIPFAATAITLVLSARALLDFAQRASEDTPALVQRLEQDALPNGKWKFQKL